MGSAIVCLSMLFVFFTRDIHLLAAAPRSHWLARLTLYGAINGICLVALTSILPSDEVPNLIRLVQASPFWIMSILWHGLLWLFCVTLNRKGRPDLGWIAALFPAPVLLVALAGAALFLRYTVDGIGVAGSTVLSAGVWWAAISMAVLGNRWKPKLFLDSWSAVAFAGMANTTAIVLVPLNALVQN